MTLIPAPKRRPQTKEKSKGKLFTMINERCKICGGMILKIQKAANRNRYLVLDAHSLSSRVTSGVRRVSLYKQHRCRDTNPQIRAKCGS